MLIIGLGGSQIFARSCDRPGSWCRQRFQRSWRHDIDISCRNKNVHSTREGIEKAIAAATPR